MKILFVSLGNICSSPLAEGILKRKLEEKQVDTLIESAGFESFNINEPPSKQVVVLAKEHNIDLSKHKCRLFVSDDFDKFDKIYAVDSASFRDVQYFSRNKADMAKVSYLLSVIDGNNTALPKLFLEGRPGLEKMFKLLDEACEIIANEVTKQLV
jgi:protein-tyrosine phosphatase